MPYKNISDLPESVTNNLPHHAQEIYRSAYNSAWEQYKSADEREDGSSREETGHKVAWSAVKNVYEKDEGSGRWGKKSRLTVNWVGVQDQDNNPADFKLYLLL